MNTYRIIYLPAGAFGYLVNKSPELIKAYLKRGRSPVFQSPADPDTLVIACL